MRNLEHEPEFREQMTLKHKTHFEIPQVTWNQKDVSPKFRTGDLARKAKVLRCRHRHALPEGGGMSVRVAHQLGVACQKGVAHFMGWWWHIPGLTLVLTWVMTGRGWHPWGYM